MSAKLAAIQTAIAGKAIERGLEASIQDGYVLVSYGPDEDKASDHLHKQTIRGLVRRLLPEARVHLTSLESGFKAEVDLPDPKEEPGLQAPPWVRDLSAEEKLEMIRQLVA